ncbi:MAG: four helix bundle protein [Candidatus Saganbacteria bacterium]|nr:four helix bundle protein [Candidatus Saganbacteria bacterium]
MSEADAASSKKDFINKVNIAKKEIMETNYWLKVIRGAGMIGDNVKGFAQILAESEELIRIIGSILFKAKNIH